MNPPFDINLLLNDIDATFLYVFGTFIGIWQGEPLKMKTHQFLFYLGAGEEIDNQ